MLGRISMIRISEFVISARKSTLDLISTGGRRFSIKTPTALSTRRSSDSGSAIAIMPNVKGQPDGCLAQFVRKHEM